MSSFWKRRVSSAWSTVSSDESQQNDSRPASRDTIIRDAVLAELAEVCGELGYMINDGAPGEMIRTDATAPSPPDELAETEAQLCQCIEALFLHGLNDSFLWQTALAIGHSTPGDRRPAPNFWPPLLIFTHRDTIEQINQLNQLRTDIGRCRAWIRTALNDGLLAAYMDTIRLDTKSLKPYYRRTAFVRDSDRMTVAQRLIADLESRSANAVLGCGLSNLTVNSSLLDRWPDRPLQLAGLYAPAVRAFPVSAGFDVASALKDDDDVEEAEELVDQQYIKVTSAIAMPKRLAIDQAFDQSIRNSPFYEPQFDHKFGLDNKDDSEDLADLLNRVDIMQNKERQRESEEDVISHDAEDEISTAESKAMGNSLMGSTTGWSLDDVEDSTAVTTEVEEDDTPLPSKFSTLVARHRKQTDGSRALNPAEVWQRFESSLVGGEEEIKTDKDANSIPKPETEDDCELLDFEVVPTEGVATVGDNAIFSLAELRLLVSQSSRIALERGIDAQDFRCAGCPTPLVVGTTTAGQLCHFSGAYYCTSCLDAKPHAIPARIIYNWDFTRRQVSRRAALFLREFEHQPFIDLRLLNPDIYSAVDEMAHIQSLRIQLNFVRAYLATCHDAMSDTADGAFARMRRQLWPRNYLYDTVHRYSLADLLTLSRLSEALQQAVTDGAGHVRGCLARCSPKGHICELCDRLDSVVFPFDVETTVRCDSCSAVFHAECSEKRQIENDDDSQLPCPRCERRKLRAAVLVES